MSVEIPRGTRITAFSGSVLEKDPFLRAKMEYDGFGKVCANSPNKHGFISVTLWHNRSKIGHVINVKASSLLRTKLLLDYNKYGEMTISDPNRPIPDHYREYYITCVHQHPEGCSTHSWISWRESRKEALAQAREFHPGATKYRAKLYRGRR